MEEIEHKKLSINGLTMHVAELGQGPIILFLHGFPECWYTWRHQIIFFASHGYRAVAPDLRGYADTIGAPTEDPSKFTTMYVVGDLVALIDAVAPPNEKVFVVGHDWGAMIAWSLCLYRPDKVKALVNMSVAFTRRNPSKKPIEGLRGVYGDEYYICRFQAEEHLIACHENSIHSTLRALPPKWQVPSRGWFKINSDASFVNGKAAYASVARNSERLFVAASAHASWDLDSTMAELKPVSLALNLADKLKLDKVVFECDSLEVVRMITDLAASDHWNADSLESGHIEEEFAQIGTKNVLKNILTYCNPGPLYLPKDKAFPDTPISLPSWLSEEDLDYYASKYDAAGFTGALNYYRSLDLNWELTAPWTGAQVKVPTKFIVGDLDLTYNAPGAKDYIQKGGFKRDVPSLEDIVVMEGVAHFIHEEKPDEVNAHIHSFFNKCSSSYCSAL